jgi:hypothetical protein
MPKALGAQFHQVRGFRDRVGLVLGTLGALKSAFQLSRLFGG